MSPVRARSCPPPSPLPPLTILLAAPRGFCAGVVRAIEIVERSLERFGAPVHMRHEIVHNRFVVEQLERKGAVFVEELEEVEGPGPVVFSAHGVPKSVPEDAARREMTYIDATCPLVSKVHLDAARHHSAGRHIFLIGHQGHPEVIGTIGQLPPGAITLVETVEDAARVAPPDAAAVAYITQTTLSVDDTATIVAALQARFPDIAGPRKQDICYATTNRQEAVKALAGRCDGLLVIGAPYSSNSRRLVEVAEANGCPEARLIERASQIDWGWLSGKTVLGLTAGASAPEVLVQEVIAACRQRHAVSVEEVMVAREDLRFRLPRQVRA